MYDKFDKTIYLILRQFSEDKSISVYDALGKISDHDYYSFSLSVRPLSHFMQRDIIDEGLLAKDGDGYSDGYRLTTEGTRALNMYTEVVEGAVARS
jgi:hypothetical protein